MVSSTSPTAAVNSRSRISRNNSSSSRHLVCVTTLSSQVVRDDIAMSDDEYFEMLEKSVDKYEYRNGVAVAMTGFTPEHVHIESNIVGELFQQLRGRECRPMGSSQAVKLAGSKGYVFPDLTVVCGKPEHIVRGDVGCLLNPV